MIQARRVVSLSSSFTGASSRAFASAKRLQTAEFELLLPAVQAFHARFGHFLVPYSFPIARDAEDWPQEARGVNVGRRLFALLTNARHRKDFAAVVDQLAILGVPTDRDWKQLLWEKRTLAALQAYVRLHGDCLVPVGFVVPSESDEYPRETWGYELGKRVAKLREHRNRLTEEELRDLESVAFSFGVDDTHWRVKILPALLAFYENHGHGFVKRDFVVPVNSSQWPKGTWGLRLGLAVHNIRCHGAYSEQLQRDKELLRAKGWIHLVGEPEDEWKTVIMPAIRKFYRLFSHSSVPVNFVVPAEDPWPRAAWGFSLGQLVHTPHALESYREQLLRDKAFLQEKLGAFWFASLDDKWDEQIRPALETYVAVHGSSSQIPQRFIVPVESPWPVSTRGLRLGEIAGRMRTRNHFEGQLKRDAELLRTLGIDRVVGKDL